MELKKGRKVIGDAVIEDKVLHLSIKLNELGDDSFIDDKYTVLLRDIIRTAHEDIFEKSPRGQVKKGQEITWRRCTKLLNLIDKARELINECP